MRRPAGPALRRPSAPAFPRRRPGKLPRLAAAAVPAATVPLLLVGHSGSADALPSPPLGAENTDAAGKAAQEPAATSPWQLAGNSTEASVTSVPQAFTGPPAPATPTNNSDPQPQTPHTSEPATSAPQPESQSTSTASTSSQSTNLASSSSGSGSVSSTFQACVIQHESRGNYQITNSSGHYGAYQFSESTWVAYGGSPSTFGNATPAEQDQVFNNAVAAGGASNWTSYDGC